MREQRANTHTHTYRYILEDSSGLTEFIAKCNTQWCSASTCAGGGAAAGEIVPHLFFFVWWGCGKNGEQWQPLCKTKSIIQHKFGNYLLASKLVTIYILCGWQMEKQNEKRKSETNLYKYTNVCVCVCAKK